MDKKTEAYVATSALIAFADRSDTFHPLFRRLFSSPPPLVTTTLVVAEGHGWFLKRYDRNRALQFIGLVEALKPMKVLSVGRREQLEAAEVLRRFSDQDLTLTDAAGLSAMELRSTNVCWSIDFRLGLTGVPLVIRQIS